MPIKQPIQTASNLETAIWSVPAEQIAAISECPCGTIAIWSVPAEHPSGTGPDVVEWANGLAPANSWAPTAVARQPNSYGQALLPK